MSYFIQPRYNIFLIRLYVSHVSCWLTRRTYWPVTFFSIRPINFSPYVSCRLYRSAECYQDNRQMALGYIGHKYSHLAPANHAEESDRMLTVQEARTVNLILSFPQPLHKMSRLMLNISTGVNAVLEWSQ
jgi:hypothetical protein